MYICCYLDIFGEGDLDEFLGDEDDDDDNDDDVKKVRFMDNLFFVCLICK